MANSSTGGSEILKWCALVVCTILLSLGAVVFGVGAVFVLLAVWGAGRAMGSQPRTCCALAAVLAAVPVLTMGALMYAFDILHYSCDAQPLFLLRYVQPLCVGPALLCILLSMKRPEHGTRLLCAAGALLWLPAMLMYTGPCCHEPYGSFGIVYEAVLLLLGLAAATLPGICLRERCIALLYLALTIPAQVGLCLLVQASGVLSFFPTLG